ncbi:MAG: diguanylate cyclase domain-containing protein [Acidimicrobiales bacterium]
MTSDDVDLQRLRAIVAAIPDPIYRMTPDGTFLSVEVPDDHPTAVPQESIPGQSIVSAMPRRQAAIVMEGLAKAVATGQLVTVEYDLMVDGDHRFWEARLVPAGDEVLAIVREITERRRSEAETLRRARTDPLTGLANRAAFEEHLEHAVARSVRAGGSVALLFADLDRFKAVNDVHGHQVGDRVLAQVGERILEAVRDVDMAARIGGDEIAILLEGVESSDAVEVIARRLVESVSAPYEVDGVVHHIGLSVGAALLPEDALTPHALVSVADSAMYRAKESGGGTLAWGSAPETTDASPDVVD